MNREQEMNTEEERKILDASIQLLQILLDSKKIDEIEKLRIIENPRIDLRKFLKNIGELPLDSNI